jgi:sarcosine oxidase, subunit delta
MRAPPRVWRTDGGHDVLQIPCPWCGLRDEIEFSARGPVAKRPDPQASNDSQWTAYLYRAANSLGWLSEYWVHSFGCGQLFALERHTGSNELRRESRE